MANRVAKIFLIFFELAVIIGLVVFVGYLLIKNNDLYLTADNLYKKLTQANSIADEATQQIASISSELAALKNQDQYKINEDLKNRVSLTESALTSAIKLYDQINEFKAGFASSKIIPQVDKDFAVALNSLAKLNYQQAIDKLATISGQIKLEKDKLLAASATVMSTTESNSPPQNGYQRQTVGTNLGKFVVDIVAADLNSTKVVIETGNDGDCRDNCNVAPLADYVARASGYAGVNGTYFCPASYPSCAGKTNSFDLLVMNKNKKYMNSENNVYSTNPAVAFYGNNVRFMEKASDWGRDTGVDAVLSNFPLLLMGRQIKYSGDGDAKHVNKGNRSFVAGNGSKAYIGVVFNATVAESAVVLQTL